MDQSATTSELQRRKVGFGWWNWVVGWVGWFWGNDDGLLLISWCAHKQQLDACARRADEVQEAR